MLPVRAAKLSVGVEPRSRPLQIPAYVLAAFWALALTSPVLADQPAVASSSCALLIGGGGERTADAHINSVWFQVDGVVLEGARGELEKRGFNVRKYYGDPPTAQNALATTVQQLNQTGCSKVVQITNFLRGDGANPATSPTFGFAVLIFHLEKKTVSGGTQYSVVGEYKKEYEYPRTADEMRSLSLSGVGKQIAADIAAAGTLVEMNTATAPAKP